MISSNILRPVTACQVLSFSVIACRLSFPGPACHFLSFPVTAFHCLLLPLTAFYCLSQPVIAYHSLSLPITASSSVPVIASHCLSQPAFLHIIKNLRPDPVFVFSLLCHQFFGVRVVAVMLLYLAGIRCYID